MLLEFVSELRVEHWYVILRVTQVWILVEELLVAPVQNVDLGEGQSWVLVGVQLPVKTP